MSWRDGIIAYLRANAQPSHKYGHQPRLYALTREIALGSTPALVYDDDVVFAACFLHDLGVFIGHRPEDPAALASWDHVAYTCEKAPKILRDAGFPEGKIADVLEVIRTHQPQDNPKIIEAVIVRDADILEQLGAVGITRTLAKLGSDTRFVTFTNARNSLQKAIEALPGKLRLQQSRDLAQPRVAILRQFLQHLHAEAGDHLN